MELPHDAPQFPKWPFLVGDAVLIGVAVYLASAAGSPLPAPAIYSITACVSLGALLAVIPFIVDYNRRQEALLTERQSALEALARTTSTAAEQASIAAGGLHEIAELAQKNLRIADHLPQKLHERINEFNRAQDEALTAEIETLQQEVNALRGSEAEKLESAADKIHRSASELIKLEANLRAQITAFETAAQRAQESLATVATQAAAAIERSVKSAGPMPAAPVAAPESPGPVPPSKPVPPPAAPREQRERAHRVDPSPPSPSPAPVATAEVEAGEEPGTIAVSVAPTALPARKPAPKRRAESDPTPFLGGLISEEPAAPVTTDEPPARRAHRPAHPPAPATPAEPRVRAAAAPTASVSTEGATRLVATAYIGIGNKLFIRGDGPGLSWDRGVPLQFVSIGKWRWETTEAVQPVAVKLFKNDEVECTALGKFDLQPGHQHEVAAEF
jgi:hypothetical protein